METAPVSILVPMDYPPFSHQSGMFEWKNTIMCVPDQARQWFSISHGQHIPAIWIDPCLPLRVPSLSIPLIHSIPITQTVYLFQETIELLYFRHWHWHFLSIWKSLSHVSTWLAFWFHTFQLKVISSVISLIII